MTDSSALNMFIRAMKSEAWRRRAWRISIFTVSRRNPNDEVEPFDLDYRQDGTYFFDPDIQGWTMLTGVKPMTPAYNYRGLANFPALTVPNMPTDMQTTYGRVLFNGMVLGYAFGDKIPFFHKGSAKDIVRMFSSRVVDEDAEDLPEGNGPIKATFRPSEVSRLIEGLFELTSMTPYVTTTGGDESLGTDPNMAAHREYLFEKYKDKLDDPATITMIQNELVEMDKKRHVGTDSELFFIDNKSYSVKRKKLFCMHGIENAFEEGTNYTLIKPSLAEGWDMNNLVAKFNSTREGSFNRGHDTALGGEKVTFLQRIYQNARVNNHDCGTKRRDVVFLTKELADTYIGLNMDIDGTLVPLTKDNVKDCVGKVIRFRRPILCEQYPKMDFCECCAGSELSKSPRAVASEISTIGSNIMYAFMGAMHGIELAVAEYDFNIHID